jgi:hypothetical protein
VDIAPEKPREEPALKEATLVSCFVEYCLTRCTVRGQSAQSDEIAAVCCMLFYFRNYTETNLELV